MKDKSNNGYSEDNYHSPQVPAFKPTFWGSWDADATVDGSGSQEKSSKMKGKMMSSKRKMGNCPNCG